MFRWVAGEGGTGLEEQGKGVAVGGEGRLDRGRRVPQQIPVEED